MLGQMMDMPLAITQILRFAERYHGRTPIVSVTMDEPRHRSSYSEVLGRAASLAAALHELGLRPGDRVATMAWNDHRHLELYFGVSCAGFVLHTVNPRLFFEQILHIMNHAGDRVLFFDPAFLPMVEKLAPRLPSVEHYVVLAASTAVRSSSLPDLIPYETLVEGRPREFDWPDIDERAASALCYTSGTTGKPRGVLYSHRSTILHAYASCLPNAMSLSHQDVVMPVVPMFHVNAWGTPYAAMLAGSKLVLPGPKMGDGEALQRLIEEEQVTVALGVPTVWLNLLSYLRTSGKAIPSLKRIIVGGAACPLSLMQELEAHEVEVRHAWGMTEMSPLGTVNVPPGHWAAGAGMSRDAQRIKQGRAPFGVDMKIVDGQGRELPWDGRAFGELKVRGWWVCSGYFRDDGNEAEAAHDGEGWFSTGDVSTIDPDGYMHITDRVKDVIKSGGEWISSIELENLAAAHPAVAEAAVIGVAHPKWGERPLLVIVPRKDANVTRRAMLEWFKGKVADWCIPEGIEVVEELPHTATGKVSKLMLRTRFRDYRFDPAE